MTYIKGSDKKQAYRKKGVGEGLEKSLQERTETDLATKLLYRTVIQERKIYALMREGQRELN